MTLAEFADARGINYNTLNQYLWRHQDLRALLTRDENGVLNVDPGTPAWDRLNKKYPDPTSLAVIAHHPDDISEIKELQLRLKRAEETIARLTISNDRLTGLTEELHAQMAIAAPSTHLLTMEQELDDAKKMAVAATTAKEAAEERCRAEVAARESAEATRDALNASLSDLRTKYDETVEERDKAVTEASEAVKQVEKLRARGLWSRIRNKDA